jgi:hypothetical protein
LAGRGRWFASDASAAPVPAGEVAELVEVPLAQTGEGIAECELLRWFVSEVCLMPPPLVILFFIEKEGRASFLL